MNKVEIGQMLHKKLTLPTKPEAVHLVESLVEEIRDQLDIKEDVYGNVMIAVTEAVNNSIVHGNKNDPQKQIFLEVFVQNPYRLVVIVVDEGEGFDPDELDDPTSPENIENIGGRGVFLMRHLSDELTFSDKGRKAEMVFNI